MKKYSIFGFGYYDRCGGMDDWICSFDYLDEIDLRVIDTDMLQIADMSTGDYVNIDIEGIKLCERLNDLEEIFDKFIRGEAKDPLSQSCEIIEY